MSTYFEKRGPIALGNFSSHIHICAVWCAEIRLNTALVPSCALEYLQTFRRMRHISWQNNDGDAASSSVGIVSIVLDGCGVYNTSRTPGSKDPLFILSLYAQG